MKQILAFSNFYKVIAQVAQQCTCLGANVTNGKFMFVSGLKYSKNMFQKKPAL